MASLKRRPGSPFFVCCYTTASGERVQKSTKQTNKEKAWEMCLGWHSIEAQARSKTLTEVTARKVISEILERTTGEPLVFHSALEWLREWLKGKGVSKSQGTHARYRNTIDHFIKHLGSRAKMGLAQITPKDVQSFRDMQLRQGKTAHTANLAVKHLRIPFNVARRQGIITTNPADAVDMIDVEKVERDTFSPEQVWGLFACAAGDWRTAILMGYYTGARLQDVCNMQWEMVDFASKLIKFRPRKTKKDIVIPIHPELATYLFSLSVPDSGSAAIMPTLAGKKTGGAHGFSSSFKAIMGAANISIEVRRKASGKGRM